MVTKPELERVALDKLVRHPANPRSGDVGAIIESVQANGWASAIVAQRSTRHILAGNHRLLAAQQLGLKDVPVMWVDVDDETALRILLADNRTSDLASWDDTALAALLQELAEGPRGLVGTGWDGDDLDQLLADLRAPFLPANPDEVGEPPETPITRPGDLWVLGEHRLLCGDATDEAMIGRLLGGETLDAIFADPPYGMDLEPDYYALHGSVGHASHRYAPVLGDSEPFDASPFIAQFDAVAEQFWWGADYYRATIEPGGSWVVWDKRGNDAGMALDAVHGAHFELCWSRQSHKREIARILWSGHHGMQGEDAKKRLHPTQKPTALAAWFFDRWVEPESTVLDPFGGSGSTLIACEQTGRMARLIEIDPGYCDVIARRFQNLTGIKPSRNDEPVDFLT